MRTKTLIIFGCSLLCVIMLGSTACAKLYKTPETPVQHFNFTRCVHNQDECSVLIKPKDISSEKFLREVIKPARKVLV